MLVRTHTEQTMLAKHKVPTLTQTQFKSLTSQVSGFDIKLIHNTHDLV